MPYLYGMASGSLRQTVYAEKFRPNFDPSTMSFDPNVFTRAVRNDRFKLIRHSFREGTQTNHLYDLLNDPFEENDLFPPRPGIERDNYRMLRQALRDLGVD